METLQTLYHCRGPGSWLPIDQLSFYRITMRELCSFISGRSTLIPRKSLDSGLQYMADITLYIIKEFVTNLWLVWFFLYDWWWGQGWFHYHALATSILKVIYLFMGAWIQVVDFYLCWPPFLSKLLYWWKSYLGWSTGINHPYLEANLSLPDQLFSLISALVFQPLCLHPWVPIYSRLP